MPKKKKAKDSPSVTFADKTRNQKYRYVAKAKVKSGFTNDVATEKWKTGDFAVARRKGRFVARKRITDTFNFDKFADSYGSPWRTLTLTSNTYYDMKDKDNRKALYKSLKKAYSKYEFEVGSFRFKYTWNQIDGHKMK